MTISEHKSQLQSMLDLLDKIESIRNDADKTFDDISTSNNMFQTILNHANYKSDMVELESQYNKLLKSLEPIESYFLL